MHQQLSRVRLTKRLSLIILKVKSTNNNEKKISLIEEKEKISVFMNLLVASIAGKCLIGIYLSKCALS